MDLNLYYAEWLMWERLREAERLALRGWWCDTSGSRSRPLRAAVGHALIHAGQWILGGAPGYAGHPGALGR